MDDIDWERQEKLIEKKMRDMEYSRNEILSLDIQHIQWFVWDFTKSYEIGDMRRCSSIINIFIVLSHNKDEIPTLQDYFGGEKIGRYKDTIHIDKAQEWITYIGEKIKGMNDDSVQPSVIN